MFSSKTTKTIYSFPGDIVSLDDDITDFGNIFDNFFAEMRGEKVFPAFNVIKTKTGYCIEMAIAGYNKDSVHITEQNGVLTITGKRQTQEYPKDSYISRGIETNSFHRSFNLGKSLEIADAILTDGMLTVTILRSEPEKTKIKKHEIR